MDGIFILRLFSVLMRFVCNEFLGCQHIPLSHKPVTRYANVGLCVCCLLSASPLPHSAATAELNLSENIVPDFK